MPIPLDMHRLSMVAESNEERTMIIGVFFRIADELIQTMDNAMRGDAYKQWKNAAHSLKGAAANLGMNPLVDKCLAAERCDESGVAKRRFLLEAIRREVQRIRDYIMSNYPDLIAA